MTDKTDNELIAEFMGFKFAFERGDRIYYVPAGEDLKYKAYKLSHVKFVYDTSWDWLMPVVEKIGELYSEAFPPNDKFMEMILAHEDPIDKHYVDVISTSICTPIKEVYETVVTFIKWYNSQPSSPTRSK